MERRLTDKPLYVWGNAKHEEYKRVQTLNEIKEEILKDARIAAVSRMANENVFKTPTESISKQVNEMKEEYSKLIDKIQGSSFEEVKEYMDEKGILLTLKNPNEMTPEDKDDVRNYADMSEFQETKRPEPWEISELKVMHSAAGYYVGREQYNGLFSPGYYEPHSRVSIYFSDRSTAESLLNKCKDFKEIMKDASPDFLEKMKDHFTKNIDEEPLGNSLKVNLINDALDERSKEKTYSLEEEKTEITLER